VGRLFTYIAITVFFFSTTGLSQLFKLPVLVNHYLEHRERDNRLDLLDFLSMHYWGQDINDNDQDRDMQLPFKGVEQHSTAQIVLIPHQIVSINRPAVMTHINQPVFNDPDLSDPALASLFRPPRA
jgi:hypothetical protein